MSTQSPLVDQADRELLVAYLDGELSPEDSAVVESRLASEARLRHELQELQHAWDALAELPRPVAAEDFTRTTLEMVAVAAQEDVESATVALPVRRKRYAFRIAAFLIAGVLAGAVLARSIWPNHNDEILENLPVIENIEAYRHTGSIDFLRKLHDEVGEPLAGVSSMGDEELEGQWQDWKAVSEGDVSFRSERIAKLDNAAVGHLHARWKRFAENTSHVEKERLAAFHRQLLEDAQSRELFATLIQFGELLGRRSAGDKADLKSKADADEQLKVVKEWIDRENRWRFERLDLTPTEKQLVRNWFQETFPSGRGGRGGPRPELSEEEEEAREAALQKSLEELMAQLSDPTQKALGDPREDSRRILWRLRNAVRPSWDGLEAYFLSDELSNNDRLELLQLPDGEMEWALWRRYAGPLFGEGPGRGRGGRRGPGRPDGRPRTQEGRGGRGPAEAQRPGPPPSATESSDPPAVDARQS
jgi:hypothetical protein